MTISYPWFYSSIIAGLGITAIISWLWTGINLGGVTSALFWAGTIQIIIGISFTKTAHKKKHYSTEENDYYVDNFFGFDIDQKEVLEIIISGALFMVCSLIVNQLFLS